MKEYNKAEREVRRVYKSTHDPEFLVYWGNILKQKGHPGKARNKFEEAIESLTASPSQIAALSHIFLNQSEFDLATKTLLQGRKLLPGEMFHNDLARIYLYQRNYEAMLNEYLALLKSDSKHLTIVKSRLQTALSSDIQDDLHDKMRNAIIRKIQAEPNVPVYSRLLIWYYQQEGSFSQALEQALAMDRRWKAEEKQILNLSNIAGQNGSYASSLKGFDYLISKGEQSETFLSAIHDRMKIIYLRFVQSPVLSNEKDILSEYDNAIKHLGKNYLSASLIMERAHLLAFYFNRPEDAEQSLKEAMKFPRLTPQQKSLIKTKLADVMICNDDFWESSLLYAQVIDKHKSSSLGDDVKYKRAQLAWFMGDIEWAVAQLDILKASTSKTIANDAMNLSLLISSNLEADSLHRPLQILARADLWQFRNKQNLALEALDSLNNEYPYHKLRAEVLFRKAEIHKLLKNIEAAEQCMDSLLNEYPHSQLADDALMKKAEFVAQNHDRKAEAAELFKQLLIDYPASIYVIEARKRYRQLRGN